MITIITTRNVCAATRAAWTWRARTRRGRVASRTRSCVTSTSRTSRSWNAQTSCNSSAVSNRRVWAVQSPGGKAPPRLFSHCRHRLAPVSKNTFCNNRKWPLSSIICCNWLYFDNLPPGEMLCSYSKNQQEALFIFNLYQNFTSTCFEQAYCSSSGGTTLYVQQLVCHAFMMSGCWQDRILLTATHHKRMTYTNCCICRVVPPDDEQ